MPNCKKCRYYHNAPEIKGVSICEWRDEEERANDECYFFREDYSIDDFDEYEYWCTDRQPDDIDDTVCGKAIRVGYNLFICGDKKGRYCADYCSEKCGSAKKRTYQLNLFEV